MTKNTAMAGALGLGLCAALAACERTGEGEYEVQRPVIGTTTDTVRVPTVDVGKDTQVIITPDIDVNTRGDTTRDTTRRP